MFARPPGGAGVSSADWPPGPAPEAPLQGGVCAVVVTYQPEWSVLDRLLRAIQPQVGAVVVVDNGSREDVGAWLGARNERVQACLSQGDNLGVARAQNIGIGWALTQGAGFVLLLDQDSEPAPDMVERLLAVARGGDDIAAVGPFYQDPRQKATSPFIQIRGFGLVRHFPAPGRETAPVDYLISSGSLLPAAALRRVGPMREDLFIDYIDIEWGLRAATAGLRCVGVFGARMAHDLGEAPMDFAGRSIPIHSPLRHYYIMRNAVLLYRQRGLPRRWKWVDASRLVLKFGFYSLFTRRPTEHLRMMLLGLWHGLRGRGGRYAEA